MGKDTERVDRIQTGKDFIKGYYRRKIRIFSDSAKKKGVEIEKILSEDLYVLADRSMLETILRNLISNAIKFSEKEGKVILSANRIKDKVELSVRDSGIGMNKELLNDLFKIDKQTNRIGTDNEPSTGLGLLLCKEFAEKNKGEIFVESEEGKGSEFRVTLVVS